MIKTSAKQFSDYIVPLEINGLNGRMLKMPAPISKKREILLVYGHHSSLERMQGLAEYLNDYGGVTMADLPGFGGMDSFYKIGQKPSLDNMADYMASVIKLRYRNRRFTIVAVSFGFLVVTRMLQKYPEIAKKVDLLVSAVGFTHKSEFKFSPARYTVYRYTASLFSRRVPSIFFRNIVLHPAMIRTFYSRTYNAKHKFEGLSREDRKRAISFEVHLWRCNDARTYMDTSISLLTVDNCQHQVDLGVHHLSVKNDNYFDNHIVEQHMRVIFSDFTDIPVNMDKHAASIIASKKESAPLVPPKLRSLLAQEP
jgi:pimeloyl-ACP methyl ester carboxylesterase